MQQMNVLCGPLKVMISPKKQKLIKHGKCVRFNGEYFEKKIVTKIDNADLTL